MKFKGEENIPINELQNNFFSCMERSDAYVICNPHSYEGFMVSTEFGYATSCIMSDSATLKKVFFTNIPLGFDKFNLNTNLLFDTFLEDLYRNPNYKNELSYFKKFKGKPEFGFYSERDFYDDLKNMYGKVLFLKSQGKLVIGIDSLLYKDNDIIHHSLSDEYER